MLLAVSEITREVDHAFLLIGGVSALLLAGITVAMIWMAVRFRRGRAKTTSQFSGNTPLEIAWTIGPLVIVTWMFFVGYEGFALMRDVPEDAMVVEVTGRQWNWTFHYPDENLDTTEMVVPVNTPVRVRLTAPPDDVVHSFYVPAFRVKEDCVPGKDTHMWFQADREGDYNIFCAEFCGKDHSKMISVMRVVSDQQYHDWLKSQRASKFKPLTFEGVEDPQAATFAELGIDGSKLYATYCAACHGAAGDGSGLPGVARDFRTADGWKQGTKVTDIFRTLTLGIDGTQMRPYPNLSPWERVALAHHVRAFLSGDVPADSQADYDQLVQEFGLDQVQAPAETIPIEKAMQILEDEADTTQ